MRPGAFDIRYNSKAWLAAGALVILGAILVVLGRATVSDVPVTGPVRIVQTVKDAKADEAAGSTGAPITLNGKPLP